MERKELALFLEQHGYKQDQWGHYKKEIIAKKRIPLDGNENTPYTNGLPFKEVESIMVHRYKMQIHSVRQEVRLGEGKNAFWHKRWSEYYCNLEINEKDKIARKKDTKGGITNGQTD